MSRSRLTSTAVILSLVWFITILGLGFYRIFEKPSFLPISLLQTAILWPMLTFWLVYWLSGTLRRYVLSLNLIVLNAVQCWRVAGISILVVWAFGHLPGGFAIPMSIFDASVGITALLAVRLAINKHSGWKKKVLLINAWGFADFIITIGLVFAGGSLPIDPPISGERYADLRRLPLCLFSGFAIPFFSCVHFAVFAQLMQQDETGAVAESETGHVSSTTT